MLRKNLKEGDSLGDRNVDVGIILKCSLNESCAVLRIGFNWFFIGTIGWLVNAVKNLGIQYQGGELTSQNFSAGVVTKEGRLGDYPGPYVGELWKISLDWNQVLPEYEAGMPTSKGDLQSK
jgi:hypothetical protein